MQAQHKHTTSNNAPHTLFSSCGTVHSDCHLHSSQTYITFTQHAPGSQPTVHFKVFRHLTHSDIVLVCWQICDGSSKHRRFANQCFHDVAFVVMLFVSSKARLQKHSRSGIPTDIPPEWHTQSSGATFSQNGTGILHNQPYQSRDQP